MKKRAILTTLVITMLPLTAFAWDNRYDSYYDERTAQEVRSLRQELEYQQDMRDYREEKVEYDAYYEKRPAIEKAMSDHYYKGPRKPTR